MGYITKVVYDGKTVGIELTEPENLGDLNNVWFSVNTEEDADGPGDNVGGSQFNREGTKVETLKNIDEAVKYYKKIIKELQEAKVKVEALTETEIAGSWMTHETNPS